MVTDKTAVVTLGRSRWEMVESFCEKDGVIKATFYEM